MQPLLQRKRGLVVQQPGKPALVAEDQLAGEKDAVRKLPLHFLGKLHQLLDPVGAEREARGGGQSVGVAVIDVERKRALQRGLELFDLLRAAIALRIDGLGADEHEVLEVIRKQPLHP